MFIVCARRLYPKQLFLLNTSLPKSTLLKTISPNHRLSISTNSAKHLVTTIRISMSSRDFCLKDWPNICPQNETDNTLTLFKYLQPVSFLPSVAFPSCLFLRHSRCLLPPHHPLLCSHCPHHHQSRLRETHNRG